MTYVLPVEVVITPSLVSPERLDEMMRMARDYSPVLIDVGAVVEGALGANFRTLGYGTWAPLADSTLRDKRRAGHMLNTPLVRTGRLYDALTTRGAPGHKFLVSEDSVTVGVYPDVVPYAAWLAGGTRRMPARVLVQLSDQDISDIVGLIKEWLGGEGVEVRVDAPLSA